MTISFFVAGDPKAQPRPRAFARKIGQKFVARVYDAGTAEGWKGQIAVAAKEHKPAEPLPGPVRLSLHFVFLRPKSHFGKSELRPKAPIDHCKKPDLDNLIKAVTDALTVLGFWRDDAQIHSLHVGKVWGLAGGCNILIESL